MEVDVRKQRRNRSPCAAPSSVSDHSPSSITPAFHLQIRRNTRRSAIRCTEELQHPPVVDSVIEVTNVRIEHPVHPPAQDSDGERVQRLVRIKPRPDPVGEAEKVRLIDGVQDLDEGLLKALVLRRGNAQRPLPPVRLRDDHPPRRPCPIRAPVDPRVQILKVDLEILPVVLLRHAVHPGRGLGPKCPQDRGRGPSHPSLSAPGQGRHGSGNFPCPV